ncbi:hypothetical protein PS862_00830 [Pseudomonas fluorescens]|uniref:Rap1a immunity protein domain-containing protein n=1 Tax=Pseudomonas fluorescens TaxID=294 RepID=A0A5E7HB21_PSEFL|nr:Rap1a/Tai family immunity protein [Pseudomonas fluorescens]VVO61274.1 hypothetical protein PS862_00830 [Pseudomonas fluorescens]
MKTGLMGAALAGLMWSGAAMAADPSFDGNELLGQCQIYIKLVDGGTARNDAHYDAGECGGFVLGVARSTALYGEFIPIKLKFCTPDTVTNSQLVRIVVKYLKDNPKTLSDNRTVLVWRALLDAYPCK